MSASLASRTSPYLEGNFGPVPEEQTAFDLPVEGALPRELDGRLLRIGPNPVQVADPSRYHWFTGDGMVHGVRLRDGRAEWYRNRWVDADGTAKARGHALLPGPRHGMIGGAVNTNVIQHAGRTFALVEAGTLPIELSDELESRESCDFGGTLTGSFTAHTHKDPATGAIHGVTYYFGWDHIRHVVVDAQGRVERELQVPVPGKPMVHDCAITESRVLLFDMPVTFQAQAITEGSPFPYVWDEAYGSRIGLLPLQGAASEVVWIDVPICYVFHPLNAYDLADGRVVVDLVRHPKMFATDKLGPNEGAPCLERWTLDPSSGKCSVDRIDDRGQEFPRLDERLTGRRHRYGYCAGFDGTRMGPTLKHDLDRGQTEVYDHGPGRTALEPVFVPRAADSAEDDGWVLSYVYDANTDTSDVVVLHAQEMRGRPVARVKLPFRVPYGFHGNWAPTEG